MLARVQDRTPSKKFSRWAVATFVAVLSTAGYMMLGPVERCETAQAPPGKPEEKEPASSVQYSLDQESAALIFANPDAKATTAGLIKWLKQQSEVKAKLSRRLVLSNRLLEKEKATYSGVKDFNVITRIKTEAHDSDVKLARLSVEDEVAPTLVDGQPVGSKEEQIEKAKGHFKFIQLASELGCEAVDFPLKVSGGYQESKGRAVAAITEIGKMMAEEIAKKKLNKVTLLFRNDANLAADGNWIAEVIKEARGSLKQAGAAEVKLGVVLDVSKAEYQPAAFLRDLSSPEPTQSQPDPKAPQDAKVQKPDDPNKAGEVKPEKPDAKPEKPDAKPEKPDAKPKPSPPADAAGGPGSPQRPQDPPQDKDNQSLVKVIILDIYDPNAGDEGYDVRGLKYFSKTLLDKMKFYGDVTLRYRGSSDMGGALADSKAKIVQALGESSNPK
jgi:hypothetical protein